MPKRVGKAKRATWKALTRQPNADSEVKKRTQILSAHWSYLPPIKFGKDEFEKMWLNRTSAEISDAIDAEILDALSLNKVPWK
jgi:hypothetical protein